MSEPMTKPDLSQVEIIEVGYFRERRRWTAQTGWVDAEDRDPDTGQRRAANRPKPEDSGGEDTQVSTA